MDAPPKRPGRPPAKTVMINVRVSEAEADALFRRAYHRRCSVSEMTRELYRRLLRDDASKPDGSS